MLRERKVERDVERLCCLGLPGEVLVPELLERLHGLFPSHWNMFFWLDERAEIVNAYAEAPSFFETLPLYFEQFHQRDEYELMGATHAEFMADAPVVDDMRNIVRDTRKVRRSAMYNVLMRPQGIYNPIYVKLREAGRPVGLLQFLMESEKHDIDAAGRKRLARLAPFIAHAIAAPGALSLDSVEDDESGILVLDRAGVLQHASPSARRLLFLAAHPKLGARELRALRGADVEVPEAVRRLCGHLDSALSERPGGLAPSHFVSNRWGRFAFRAYPLEPLADEGPRVGVLVQRQVPAALALWRCIRKAALPARQTEVCFHLASGRGYAEIADRMKVSINTVTWHVREVYRRFDVHGAAELTRKLRTA